MAESEHCSDPLNLLVRTSVGMWCTNRPACSAFSIAIFMCLLAYVHFPSNKKGDFFMGTTRTKTLFLVEVAIFTAIAYLLDLVSEFFGAFLSFWPQGGSISIEMVPIILMAFRWGIKGGLLTGFLFGSIQLISGFASIYYLLQILFDYSLAFAVVGFAGLLKKPVQYALQNQRKGQILGYTIIGSVVGGLLRYFIHFISGVTFFAQYAPPDQPIWLYSILYNGGYMIPSIVLTAIVVYLLLITSPKQMMRKEYQLD